MVGAVEAVVTMTMAAVPGMAMAVVTVTPAVGVTHIHLAVVNEWADRRGARPPLSIEATLPVIRTAAQVVEGLAVAVVAVDLIEEWVATDTELDLEITLKANFSVRAQLTSVLGKKTNYPCLNLWNIEFTFELHPNFPSYFYVYLFLVAYTFLFM